MEKKKRISSPGVLAKVKLVSVTHNFELCSIKYVVTIYLLFLPMSLPGHQMALSSLISRLHMRALRSRCSSASIQRGEGAWKLPCRRCGWASPGCGAHHPTHILSAGALSYGTVPPMKSGKCSMRAGKEEGVGLAIS